MRRNRVLGCRRVLAVLLAAVLLASFAEVTFAAEDFKNMPVLYTGVTTRELTVRQTRNQAGKKLESLASGEKVDILAFDRDDWFLIRKGEVEGYIVGRHVTELVALTEENPLPAKYGGASQGAGAVASGGFQAMYWGKTSARVALRREPTKESKLLATIYAGEQITLGDIGDEWTMVKYGKHTGFMLSEFATSLELIDPFAILLAGARAYPYAAIAMESVSVYEGTDAGSGFLQTLPEGAVIAIAEPDEAGTIYLPYKRTIGMVEDQIMRLEAVIPHDEAQPGDLLAVFSTFFAANEGDGLAAGRLHNIKVGVELFSGHVIKAGERFSFNDMAAPYTKENGYENGPIINYVSEKKTGYGGGICQVSTTLYNVLLQLPIRIVKQQPHSSYGIDYAPVGYDAAVGSGGLDFVFENSLPYDVALVMNVWPGVVTVRMYRVDEDGGVTLDEPTVADDADFEEEDILDEEYDDEEYDDEEPLDDEDDAQG